jgi:hypothetical protein
MSAFTKDKENKTVSPRVKTKLLNISHKINSYELFAVDFIVILFKFCSWSPA